MADGDGPRLDAELVRRGLARSRAQARVAIDDGRVRVGGRVADRASRRVRPEEDVELLDPDRWVARSAHKLVAALDAFAVPVAGRLCLDVGASTGGFTQVLLERGAREVVALDVGHGQLVGALRADGRVRVVEGRNARDLDGRLWSELAGTDEPPGLVVVDVSFIPLRLVLPALAGVLAPAGDLVVLVKPQFEVGRGGVREGVVRDRDRRHDAVRAVLREARNAGLGTVGLISSPLPGSSGNREYLAHLTAAAHDDPTEWDRALADLP